MNDTQTKAATQLKKALNACAKAGLQGGIYEGTFCVWPITARSPHEINDSGETDFYTAVEAQCEGKQIHCKMHIDGGNGW